MFIHLSDDIIIRMSDVVAILNYDTIHESPINTSFLKSIKHDEQVIDMADNTVKSIVITESNVYFTPFSTATLRKRSQLSITT